MPIKFRIFTTLLKRRFGNSFQIVWKAANVSESGFLIGVALLVGVSTGLGAAGFRWLIHTARELFWGHGYEWLVPLIPMLGGLLVGPIVHFYAREAKGHGVPEVMAAVALRSGVIRPRVAMAKAVASAICIGSGGSAGREGPIIQIGAAIGSTIGQVFRMSGERVKVLVGCGAAAGISAVFNAPIAGMIFALEIILGDFAISTFSPVILSSVLASVVSRAIYRNRPVFRVPQYELVTGWEVLLYAILGILAGLVAIVFIKSLYKTEDFFDHKVKIPQYIKPALGGLALGLLGLLSLKLNYSGFTDLTGPAIFFDGYEAIGNVLGGSGLWYTVLALVFFKIAATSLTLGSGSSGGIFAPSLFIGAMLGSFFGILVHTLFPSITANPGAYALVGMAAVVAGATHATITSILIVFEMTNDYRIVLALMVSCVFATLVARKYLRYSIYTLKLNRRGIELSDGKVENLLNVIRVRDIMRREYSVVRVDDNLDQIARALSDTNANAVPVLSRDGRLAGVLSIQDLRTALSYPEIKPLITAIDIASKRIVSVMENDNLKQALGKFTRHDSEMLPVVSALDPTLLQGIIYKHEAINHYNNVLIEALVRHEPSRD